MIRGNLLYSQRQLLTFDHKLASPCLERLTLAFLSQLSQKRFIYLKRKPYYPLFERSFETERIFAMKDSRPVLVKPVLFQTRSTKTCLKLFMAIISPISILLLTLLGLTPFEFLIGLSLCLRGTGQESQVWSHQKLKNHVILPAGIILN